ncbi:hypothetical protein [Rhizobium sp. FKY42]|uniref:hypothetical protein n=1 Tax=Rhizobium sp. FKY42 TaxID=2562310 RepID=UPI0010C13A22|nr:hypothetical protein [Rhizobium sp. FKY42]
MSKVLAPKGRGGRLCAIYELPGRQRRALRLLVSRCPFGLNSQQSRAACLMQDYNLWADLLATFRASPDAIKALWLLVPPVFVLGVLCLMIRLIGQRRPRTEPQPITRSRDQGPLLDHTDFQSLTIASEAQPQPLPLSSRKTITLGDPS